MWIFSPIKFRSLWNKVFRKRNPFFKRQDELEELIKEIDLKVVIDTSSQMKGESNGRNDGVYAKYSAADII